MLRSFVTVPAFRFSLGAIEDSIGKWSRGATFGYKGAKGEGLDFNVETLGQIVDNAAKRGDKIAICADHLSILGPPVGKDAPSLGFFYALALFANGQLVKHWAMDGGSPPSGTDDAGNARDGLYCRLGEITPRGRDPLHGLANFGFLSPAFPPPESATDQEGNKIGYSLLDFAATSAPFQSGCELQLHQLSAPAAAEAKTMADVGSLKTGDLVTDRRGDHGDVVGVGVVSSINGNRVWVNWNNGKRVEVDASQLVKAMSAAPSGKGAVEMAGFPTARCPECGNTVDLFKQSNGWHFQNHRGVDWSGKPSSECRANGNLVPAGTSVNQMSTGAPSGKGATSMAAGDKACPVCGSTTLKPAWGSTAGSLAFECSNGHKFPANEAKKMSTGAPRAFNSGASMDPELMKRMGLGDDPGVAEKMAAYSKHAMGEATDEELCKMADDLEKHEEPEAKAMAAKFKKFAGPLPADGADQEPTLMDVDPSNAAQNAAVHIKTGAEHSEAGSVTSGTGQHNQHTKKASRMSATERDSMLALAASLRAKGVTVPGTATRTILMSLAATVPAAPDASAIKAEVKRQRAEERAAEEAEARAKEAEAIVTMARNAKVPDHVLTGLSIVAKSDLATARMMASQYGPGTAAPPHLFSMLTGPNGPIGAPAVSHPTPPASVRADGLDRKMVTMAASVHGSKIAVLSAAGWSETCRHYTESKDAVIMGKIAAHYEDNGPAWESFNKYVAAEKVLMVERPDLYQAARAATSIGVGA